MLNWTAFVWFALTLKFEVSMWLGEGKWSNILETLPIVEPLRVVEKRLEIEFFHCSNQIHSRIDQIKFVEDYT